MPEKNNYYDILGISQNASSIQIKEAYIYKVHLLHPDRLTGVSERIRRKAEEELVLVNEAYTVLSNPEARRQYDLTFCRNVSNVSNVSKERRKQADKPKVGVFPRSIEFKDVPPNVKKRDIFFVRNIGGPFNKVLISKTPDWLTVVRTKPLEKDMKLPMMVLIEAVGKKWGATYTSPIIVRLDSSEAKVMVKLRVKNRPKKFLF